MTAKCKLGTIPEHQQVQLKIKIKLKVNNRLSPEVAHMTSTEIHWAELEKWRYPFSRQSEVDPKTPPMSLKSK